MTQPIAAKGCALGGLRQHWCGSRLLVWRAGSNSAIMLVVGERHCTAVVRPVAPLLSRPGLGGGARAQARPAAPQLHQAGLPGAARAGRGVSAQGRALLGQLQRRPSLKSPNSSLPPPDTGSFTVFPAGLAAKKGGPFFRAGHAQQPPPARPPAGRPAAPAGGRAELPQRVLAPRRVLRRRVRLRGGLHRSATHEHASAPLCPSLRRPRG